MLPYLLANFVITHSFQLNENSKIMPFHHYLCSDSFTIWDLWVLGLAASNFNESQLQTYEPGRVAQSVTCLATDASLTADPGVASSTPARSHTFVEIDHEIISKVILLPSAESFKKGCLSVTSESMCTKYWLTACSSLPRKKCG